jgi:RhtB (resistance to homoserine/threonine) family protein
MSFFTEWMTVFAIGLIAVVSPGPDFALTLRNSLAYSRQAGIYTAVGVTAGHIIHATYCLVGIGAIISQSILLFNLLKWLGAAYLIYIGFKSLKAKKQSYEISSLQRTKDISRWMAFRMGLLGDVLNPKATLFFLALFTQIIHPATPLAAQLLYGITIVLIALVWYNLVAIAISQRTIKNALQSVLHWLERLTGAVLIALGLRLATAKAND